MAEKAAETGKLLVAISAEDVEIVIIAHPPARLHFVTGCSRALLLTDGGWIGWCLSGRTLLNSHVFWGFVLGPLDQQCRQRLDSPIDESGVSRFDVEGIGGDGGSFSH